MVLAKKKTNSNPISVTPSERVTSVIGPGINWKGDLRGKGGVRIEGTMEGEIAVHGLIVIGETGRVTCETLKADSVIVAGSIKGNISTRKLEIRATGRVWGDVITTSFSTEEGAFLRGQICMEDDLELDFGDSDTDQSVSEENVL